MYLKVVFPVSLKPVQWLACLSFKRSDGQKNESDHDIIH